MKSTELPNVYLIKEKKREKQEKLRCPPRYLIPAAINYVSFY